MLMDRQQEPSWLKLQHSSDVLEVVVQAGATVMCLPSPSQACMHVCLESAKSRLVGRSQGIAVSLQSAGLQGANILVSQNNMVKLADFGAAKDKLGQVTIGRGNLAKQTSQLYHIMVCQAELRWRHLLWAGHRAVPAVLQTATRTALTVRHVLCSQHSIDARPEETCSDAHG